MKYRIQLLQTIKRLLAHPGTKSLEVDDPRTTLKRHEIISSNRFLWRIYDEWYRLNCACILDVPGTVRSEEHTSELQSPTSRVPCSSWAQGRVFSENIYPS